LHSHGRFAPAIESLERRSLLSVAVGTNFRGLVFSDTLGAVPPDTNLAVGPQQVLELVNNNIAVYSKSGSLIAQASLYDALAALSPSLILTDPQVTYDEQAGRFVVGLLDIDPFAEHSWLDLAVSRSSDLTQGFSEVHKISLDEILPPSADHPDGATLFGDFPRLGWNADSYCFTLNMFPFPITVTEADVEQVQIITIDKSSVLDNDPGTLTVFHADRVAEYNMVPVVMHDATAGMPMVFASQIVVEEQGGVPAHTGYIRFTTGFNLLSSSPTFGESTTAVPSSDLAPDETTPPATQPGGLAIATNDPRILTAVWRNNHIVATQVIGDYNGIPGPMVRWMDFSAGDFSVHQLGTINPPSGSGTYFPAAEIAPNGDIGITYMQSGPDELMSTYFTGRKAADSVGTLQAPRRVKAGEAIYNSVLETPPFRAGDFAGISVDPINGSFWFANEYATRPFNLGQSLANWGTWIGNAVVTGRLVLTPVAPPVRVNSLGTLPMRAPVRAVRIEVLEIVPPVLGRS
jgi:hypothetical protein